MTTLDRLTDPPRWQDLSLCKEVDTEIFYPEKGGSTREAKSVCAGCDVRGECLDTALYGPGGPERFGIWGGYSERERRRMLATPKIGDAA